MIKRFKNHPKTIIKALIRLDWIWTIGSRSSSESGPLDHTKICSGILFLVGYLLNRSIMFMEEIWPLDEALDHSGPLDGAQEAGRIRIKKKIDWTIGSSSEERWTVGWHIHYAAGLPRSSLPKTMMNQSMPCHLKLLKCLVSHVFSW